MTPEEAGNKACEDLHTNHEGSEAWNDAFRELVAAAKKDKPSGYALYDCIGWDRDMFDEKCKELNIFPPNEVIIEGTGIIDPNYMSQDECVQAILTMKKKNIEAENKMKETIRNMSFGVKILYYLYFKWQK